MAKIEGEMRQYLEKVGHGEEVTMYKFKTSIHGEDCHYPGRIDFRSKDDGKMY